MGENWVGILRGGGLRKEDVPTYLPVCSSFLLAVQKKGGAGGGKEKLIITNQIFFTPEFLPFRFCVCACVLVCVCEI